MRAALLIARKDLRERLRDRSAIVVAIVIPFVLALVLGATLPGVTGDGEVTYDFALVDDDGGTVARRFDKDVLRPLERDDLVNVKRARSSDEARQLVRDGEVTAAFVLPARLSERVRGRRAASLTVIGDHAKQIDTFVARSIGSAFASHLDGVRLAVVTVARTGPR